MKQGKLLFIIALGLLLGASLLLADQQRRKLSAQEAYVIQQKGTERPFSGKYLNNKKKGIYRCKQCAKPLFRSDDKFDSGSGWPSFDDSIPGAVKEVRDADGFRTEIVCANCGGHLGHVFRNEGFTKKACRHCVNSISLQFEEQADIGKAIFAGGCFWGVEYWFEKEPGVIKVTSGYTGGEKSKPTYRQVSWGMTKHLEAVEVIYDKQKTTYEKLARLFFETHDPSHVNRQGPDHGYQYSSAIFYLNEEQEKIAKKLITELMKRGYKVATKVRPAKKFWPAEKYHQNYYKRKGTTPYCHSYEKRF